MLYIREAGVPVVTLLQNGWDYFDLHHTADDTLDKIAPDALDQNVAAYVAFLYLRAIILSACFFNEVTSGVSGISGGITEQGVDHRDDRLAVLCNKPVRRAAYPLIARGHVRNNRLLKRGKILRGHFCQWHEFNVTVEIPAALR